jgi:hypothetical protein
LLVPPASQTTTHQLFVVGFMIQATSLIIRMLFSLSLSLSLSACIRSLADRCRNEKQHSPRPRFSPPHRISLIFCCRRGSCVENALCKLCRKASVPPPPTSGICRGMAYRVEDAHTLWCDTPRTVRGVNTAAVPSETRGAAGQRFENVSCGCMPAPAGSCCCGVHVGRSLQPSAQ